MPKPNRILAIVGPKGGVGKTVFTAALGVGLAAAQGLRRAPVEVTLPTGEKKTVTLDLAAPGVWRKTLPVKAHGVYRLASGERVLIRAPGAGP